MADLVARKQHRHSLREEQGREKVADLPQAERSDRWILRRPFDAAVPAQILIVPILIVLAVRLVVLLVVTHQVVERKAVVRGDKIDARVRLSPVAAVEVRRTGQPISESASL